MKLILMTFLLAAVLVSGCTASPGTDDSGTDSTGGVTGDPEAQAYDQIEQELDQAIEDIDLDDLESELLA